MAVEAWRMVRVRKRSTERKIRGFAPIAKLVHGKPVQTVDDGGCSKVTWFAALY